MSARIELLHIPFSPWSEKARWALEACGVPYRSRHYQPLLGEPELRVRLRKWRGNVSVPVLFTPSGPLADSLAIARWASRQAAERAGADLFPAGTDAVIERWITLGERGLAAGRARSLQRVLNDRAALVEMVPKRIAPMLGPLAPKIAAGGIRRTLRKYGATGATHADHGAALAAVLDELRAGLADGRATLLPEHGFTFADIAMAQVLAFVAPPASGLRIGKANRVAFRDPDLAERYANLVAWRDALYARHRSGAAEPGRRAEAAPRT